MAKKTFEQLPEPKKTSKPIFDREHFTNESFAEYQAKCEKMAKADSFAELVENLLNEVKDPIIRERKKEVLDNFDLDSFLQRNIPNQKDLQVFRNCFRGIVFEHLANWEMNDEEENGLLGEFILRCLHNPRLLDLSEPTMKNPDRLGVVIDREHNIAYVSGMYECKVGKLDERAKTQFRDFYHNIQAIAVELNKRLSELKEKYDLDFIPEGGLELKTFESMEKFVVVPFAQNRAQIDSHRDKKRKLEDLGWQLRTSVLSYGDIDAMTIFIGNYYLQNKEKFVKKNIGKYEKEEEIKRSDR